MYCGRKFEPFIQNHKVCRVSRVRLVSSRGPESQVGAVNI